MVVDSEPNALLAFVAQWGNVIFFFGQLAFWVALAAAAFWATLIFKRYVDFMTGVVKETDELIEGDATAETETDVDAFTE